MLKRLEKKNLIIFDLDGTLVKTNQLELEVFFKLLSNEANAFINPDISSFPNRSFASAINSLPLEIREQCFNSVSNELAKFVEKQTWLPVVQGVDFLNEVQKLNCDYSIVTGNFHLASQCKLRKADIKVDISKLVATSLDFESKLDIFQGLIDKKGCSKSEVISLGDSLYDAEIAEKLGIDFIMVT